MAERPILGICIPTYNRAAVLEENLNNLIQYAAPLTLPIYVSDNCSPDNTREVVERIRERYPHIVYSRNEENIGPDRNFQRVLSLCEARYAWLLGDDDTITRPLDRICGILACDCYDALVFASAPNHEDTVYTDKNEILIHLAGAMTWMSGLIINRELIGKMNFERYNGSQFVHTGALLEALCYQDSVKVYNHDFSDGNRVVDPLRKYHSGYAENSFDIFTDKWMSMICSLPYQYPFEAKLKAIVNLGTAPFRTITLIMYRAWGVYDYGRLRKQQLICRRTGLGQYIKMLAVAWMPRWMAKGIFRFGRYVRKKKYGF